MDMASFTGERIMTTIPLVSNRILSSPWGSSKPAPQGRSHHRQEAERIGKGWMFVPIILAVIITYMVTTHLQTKKLEHFIQTRAASVKNLTETTKLAEELKNKLAQTETTFNELSKKEAGSATIINNLVASKKELSAQIETMERQWQSEKQKLVAKIALLERSNGQVALRPNTGNIPQPASATGSVEQVFLNQAQRFAAAGQSTGCIDGDCNQGHGIWRFDNGDMYVGSWNNGVKEGQGLYRYAHGAHYFGSWSSDMKHGHGTYQFANGARYDGGWFQGQRHGLGVEIQPNGNHVQGQWHEGKQIS